MAKPNSLYYERMHHRIRFVVLIAVAVLMVAACSGDDEGEGSTTTSTEATVTSLGVSDDNASGDDGDDTAATESTTSTTVASSESADPDVPTFSIVTREPGDEGDTVVVLLDPESYDTLTDIDLQNVLAVLVEDFPPVYEAHVVDSEDVTELVLAARSELDAEGRRLLNLHYLVRLDEGFRITYVGPFEDVPTAILGS